MRRQLTASSTISISETTSKMATQCTDQPLQTQETLENHQKQTLTKWILTHREGQLAVFCGLALLFAYVLGYFSSTASVILYTIAYFTGGYYKAREGIETLITEKDLDVNLLMILAALGAALIGYWAEGAMLIFIFALSGALETYTLAKSKQDISALIGLNPEHAIRLTNHQEELVPVIALQLNDTVLVKPGQRVPADGVIISGDSALNEASITGESLPVDKTVDDHVFAGTLNGQGSLMIKVTKRNEDTLLAKVIRLVQEAQDKVPKKQSFIAGFERIYAWVVLGVTALLILVPPIWLQIEWQDSFYRAMVFLVVASPCALVASIMPAILSAISNTSRKGILFKGGAHLESIARAQVIAFDKTGTLTIGKPKVEDIIPFQDLSKDELLTTAASMESLSTHPIASAIVEHASILGLRLEQPSTLQSVTGLGLKAQFKQESWRIGKPSFISGSVFSPAILQIIERLESEGKTVIVAQNSQGIAGILSLRDQIRPEAKGLIHELKSLGIKTVMLTGDQPKTAEIIGQEAGIDHIYAGLLPEDKAQLIEQLQKEYGTVVMVGDGVNDAPALALADIGIAMGGAGSDAALDTADLVLMNDDLTKLKTVLNVSKRSRSVILQNICFSLTVILLLIGYNFIEGIALPLGVIFHEGSTILVILNGLRLLR